jgi:hypothetical protein
MWILATDAGGILAIIIGLVGLGGVVFTALRFRRDDTTAIVGQQDVILNDFKSLNEELRITADRLRTERDECGEQVEKLRSELGEVHGGVTRIEEKLNGDD